MKKLSYIASLFLLLPKYASAHVKWFVDSENIIATSHQTNPFYSWGSTEVLAWSGIVLVTVFVFSVIDGHIKTPNKLLSFGLTHEKSISRIAQIVLGLFLVSVSFLWKIVIIPEMHVATVTTTILEYIQIAIGLMYIFNIKPQIASLGLIALTVSASFSGEGFITILENAILISLAAYFYIIHAREDSRISLLFKKHAVEIVRIGTGISLITLAFTEKFLYPELSLQFLQIHHWNFMQPLFPWFTNELFVLSTGFAEMIFGILFIMGYITRATTILIAVFFGLSVTTMLIQFHAWEVEDLVVYAAAILFIFFGHGRTKFFHFMWKDSFLHRGILKKTESL